MAQFLQCDALLNIEPVIRQLDKLLDDDATMLEVYSMFAKMCDPYVPMQEGVLSQSVQIMPDRLRYPSPYAHYMYEGIVYGPNIPIFENGIIVGWFSPPGQKKHPTGKLISYSTDRHPLASAKWDQKMLADKGEEFAEQLNEILARHYNSLNG